ncbi:Ferredoxin NADP+ reductase [Spraguea lophii 42_110]|uniref:Ferredoxin NADP+ reductase n=1 Tax=Spraguea lophii (strain 42_110) TaxID=1358809 RepID=S7WAI6_SPRLO|nr:Ferredoxin NADP+ reductase [Spraguea lophii 42_110]
MKLCIVGGGPSAFYLSRFLHKHFDIDIYEKTNKPFGLFNLFSHRFENNPFTKDLEKVKIFYNKKLNKLPEGYDVYAIAIGGVENKLNIEGNEHVMTAIEACNKIQKDLQLHNQSDKNIKSFFNTKDKIIIIGMGNTSLDIASDLFKLGIEKVKIFSRNNFYKFTIPEIKTLLRDNITIKLKNLKDTIKNNILSKNSLHSIENNNTNKTIDKIQNTELLKNNRIIDPITKLKETLNKFKNNSMKNLSLFFNTEPLKIEKKDNLILHTNTKEYEADHIITSIGYNKPDISSFKDHNKKIYTIGWANMKSGNLADVFYDCKNKAKEILKDNNIE